MVFATDAAAGDRRPAWVKQIRSLAIILRDEFGVPFRFYQAATGAMLREAITEDPDVARCQRLEPFPAPALVGPRAVRLVADGMARVQPLVGGRFQLALPFTDPDHGTTIAVAVMSGLGRTPTEVALELARLGRWLHAVHRRLVAVCRSSGSQRHRADSSRLGDSAVGLEALLCLEQLLRLQRIGRDLEQNQKQILTTAAPIMRARVLLWLPADGKEALIEGEPLLSAWECAPLARLLVHHPDATKAGFLINNQVQANSWGALFPQVATMLAVPVPIRSAPSWLIALNRMPPSAVSADANGRKDGGLAPSSSESEASSAPGIPGVASFRRIDAALLLPFAALLAVHLRAARRYANPEAADLTPRGDDPA
jgi:hypothetical protein